MVDENMWLQQGAAHTAGMTRRCLDGGGALQLLQLVFDWQRGWARG